MRIMKSLLNNHNQNIIREQPQSTPKKLQLFKERKLSNEWFMSYRKSVVLHYNQMCQKNYTKKYKGIRKTIFKKRYANHEKSFNVPT